jgi:uncharacterized protein (DUF2147 family)
VILAAALALPLMMQASPSAAPSPPGLWRTHVNDGLIRIEQCGDELCGHVAGSAELKEKPDQADVLNHDPSLRGRLVMGLLVLKLKPVAPGRWGDGWIYDPRRGATYSAKIQMAPDGRLRLTGCIASFLCQTQIWTRAD